MVKYMREATIAKPKRGKETPLDANVQIPGFGVMTRKQMQGSIQRYISEIQKRIRYGCKSDILGLVGIRNVGRVRAREMKIRGLETIYDVSEMGPRDRSKLEALRGWSPKLVENIITNAQQIILRKNKVI